MIKILANDGIHPEGKTALEAANYAVITDKIAQDDLQTKLQDYDVIIVRSATKVRKDLIDACPNLKVIARAGVGLDNIDVEHAKSKGIQVINTPAASSQAVAELAFGHMYSLARFIYQSNRQMPSTGDTEFKNLKKAYAKGVQLRGKTLGIIGFGRIGQATARCGIGAGMKIMATDPFVKVANIDISPVNSIDEISVDIETVSMEEMLKNSDFISLHIPFTGEAVLSTKEFEMMKDGVFVVNCARGGTIDENALLKALESGKVSACGLDVFETEPNPRKELLEHPRVSLTPHIGASTNEAQVNIGMELADKIKAFFNN